MKYEETAINRCMESNTDVTDFFCLQKICIRNNWT
jgi:hypothetical protein